MFACMYHREKGGWQYKVVKLISSSFQMTVILLPEVVRSRSAMVMVVPGMSVSEVMAWYCGHGYVSRQSDEITEM